VSGEGCGPDRWRGPDLGLRQKGKTAWIFYWERLFPVMLLMVFLLPVDSGSLLCFLPGLFLRPASSPRLCGVVLWLLWALLSRLWGPFFPAGLLDFFGESIIVLAAYAAGSYGQQRKSWWPAVWLALSLVLCLIFVQALAAPPYPSAWASPTDPAPFRATGAGLNPNTTGLLLAFFLPILLAGWEGGHGVLKKRERRLAGLLFLLSLPALAFTFSRTAWSAAVAALLFYGGDKTRYFRRRWLLIPFLAVLLFPTLQQRIQAPWQSSTFQYRWQIWQETWVLMKKYPLTGVGKRALASYLQASTLGVAHLHNHYWQLMVEKGLPALFIFGGLVYANLIRPFVRKQKRGELSFLERGVTAALLGQLVAGLAESIWASPLLQFLFWFGFALLDGGNWR
jgi:O-antigen ligase